MERYLPTGNEMISLPKLNEQTAAIEDLTFLSMQQRGMIELCGTENVPLMQPFIQIDQEELALTGLQWSREHFWIPSGHKETEQATVKFTVLTPVGERGFAMRLSVTARTDCRLKLGARGLWSKSVHCVNEDKELTGQAYMYESAWNSSFIMDYRVGFPAFALAPMSDHAGKSEWAQMEDGISYQISCALDAKAGQEEAFTIFWGLGFEEVAAATSAKEQLRRGWNWLYRKTADWLDKRTVQLPTPELTEVYNVIANIPSILLISVIVLIMSASFWTMVFALTITGWIGIAYFIRTQVIIIRDREYNLASRCLGTPITRIASKNILPFMTSVIVTLAAAEIPSYTSYEVFLSYIGMGLKDMSLGKLIEASQNAMQTPGWEIEFWTPVAVASIIKVIAMSTLTDAYGDVPYFEALQGYTSGGTEFTPRYDSQKEIYRDMFRLLEEANTLLAQSKENFDASEDYMYKGDIKKWRKLGNSIYLRLLMRAALKDEVDVETESLFAVSKLNQIFSYPADYPVFESREDAADVPFNDAVAAQQTPFFSWRAGSWNSNMICERLMNEMYVLDSDENVILSDPRLSFYFDNKRVGAPTQVTYQELVPYVDIVAHYNRGLIQNRDHFSIMCFSEIWFIWAEAAHRKWISGTAKSYYDRAVAESVYEWNPDVSESIVSSFLSNPLVSLDGLRDDAALERIMTQKWISTVLVGIEAWCDYRRTGYPEMPVKSLAGNDGVLPTRLLYPADEEFRNPVNYDEAVNGWLGGVNNMKTEVWWADHNQKRKKE